MRRFQVPGAAPPSGTSGRLGMTRAERRRLVSMLVGLGLVLAMLFAGWLKSREARRPQDLPREELDLVEKVHVPTIDPARLSALVDDHDERGRVVLEPAALDAILADVRRLTPASFEALGIEPLDEARIAALREAPDPLRGRAFRMRGSVRTLETRRAPKGGEERHLGLVDLEGGGQAWFLALAVPELGSFVRVDGLFLKNYRAEAPAPADAAPGAASAWIDAPLLVAPRAERSYRDLGHVDELDAALLAQVEDDRLVFEGGSAPHVTGLPFDALWQMMAWVRDLPEDAVDWEAVPELDAAALAAMLADGTPLRGKPFRLPISRLQGVRVKRAGENPARLEAYTEGWMGNATWQNVVHFKTPARHPELGLSDYVHARGFFLKDFAYESAQRGLRVAPVFVLQDIVAFEPQEDPAVRRLAFGVAGGVALFIAWLVLRVRRDRKRSREAAASLLERKRKRRARSAGQLGQAGQEPLATHAGAHDAVDGAGPGSGTRPQA